ncbi:hypothetical protein MKL09_26795 [Methylobacterium sp. J-048]|uniref:hypothetical protein n=1 Tax=Methylobacterium sp. J-048 TaxID=2836635 RepID=UPI001FBB5397|nr:hypothetical protein [Methylobacterium sp. J-048]MCJ2060126.1 hypothetical protein [Methylobacterium sp. J-048]
MSAPVSRRDNLANVIFDMETIVRDCVKWGEAVRDLGLCENDVKASGLWVIGNAIMENARQVEAEWERCFDLSRSLREGAR